MLLAEKNRPKIRDFRGPEPGSVGILGRNPGTGSGDKIVQNMIKEREFRQAVEEQVKYQQSCYLRGKWESDMDRNMKNSAVQRGIQKYRRMEEVNLEQRRDRLRDLLVQEEKVLAAAFEATQETTLERQAKLREKAKQLKDQKEKHMSSLAQEKYDQLWREQCEELRAKMSKKQCQEIAAERWEQVRMKEALAEQQKEEDAFFLKLWEEDMEKKLEREVRDAQAQKTRDMEQAVILKQQIESFKSREEEAKALKLQEAQLLEDLARMMKVEAEEAAKVRHYQQQETRELLESSVRAKMRRRAREIQEELDFDMALLAELEEMAKEESSQEAQRKQELREQDRRYREYLRQVKAEEAAKERELERLCDAEIERQYQRRAEQWKKERATRRALMAKVIEGRKAQIQERLMENEKRQAEAQAERERILAQIQENRRLDEAERYERHRRNMDFSSDLQAQIAYNADMRRAEEDEKQRERVAMKEAELRYQQRLHETLSEDWTHPRLHPMRRAHLLNEQKMKPTVARHTATFN